MAKANSKTKKVVYLTLTEKEAKWLKELTQNYLGGSEYPFTEPPDEKKIREDIFKTLKKELDK